MQLTIIIPTYNEAENIPRLVPVLLNLPIPDLRLIFIDDNSPDGTGQIIDELVAKNPSQIQVHHRAGKLGLGSAYIVGYQMALDSGADLIGQMDADFSHPPEKIPELIEKLQEGYDIVLGSRYIAGGSVDEQWPFWRKWLSRWGNFYARSILRIPLSDVTGAFRIWQRETLATMPLDKVVSNGYVFQIEVVYIAHKLGYRFGEVPIYFADRKWGVSKMSLDIQIEAALRIWQLLFSHRNLS